MKKIIICWTKKSNLYNGSTRIKVPRYQLRLSRRRACKLLWFYWIVIQLKCETVGSLSYLELGDVGLNVEFQLTFYKKYLINLRNLSNFWFW